jgi:hypothetical protein
MDYQTIKWTLEQADIWNDTDSDRSGRRAMIVGRLGDLQALNPWNYR